MTARSTSSQGQRRCRTSTSPGFFRTRSGGQSRTCLSPLRKPASGWGAPERLGGQSKAYSPWRHTSEQEDRRPPSMTRCGKSLDAPRDLLRSSRGITRKSLAATECLHRHGALGRGGLGRRRVRCRTVAALFGRACAALQLLQPRARSGALVSAASATRSSAFKRRTMGWFGSQPKALAQLLCERADCSKAAKWSPFFSSLLPLRRAFGRRLLQRRTRRPTSGQARPRRRNCRASSTTCRAGSGGNPLASPPKSPDGRAV
jgi:hypothetical protein